MIMNRVSPIMVPSRAYRDLGLGRAKARFSRRGGPDWRDRSWRDSRGLPALLVEVHWRQVLDVMLGDIELDPGIEPGHCADRDGDVLA
jgi:hypothetical protein